MATANAEITSFISSSLPDIAALSSLIGSPTAESLTLGDRGASGLPWAAMSVFGSISISKACISVSTPSWMKEAIGVRNAAVEAAVGLSLNLSSAYMDRDDKTRKSFGEPVGILCQRKELDGPELEYTILRDVYVFDRLTSNSLFSLPPSQSTGTSRVHVFMEDHYYKGPITKTDLIALLLSFVKLIEVYVLWAIHGARALSIITAAPWLYFLFAAAIIFQQRVPRGYKKDPGHWRQDILAGQLPTIIKPGGARRILLGIPLNFRDHLIWRLTWLFGAPVCIASLVGIYLVMRQTPRAVTTWFGFQGIWLFVRSLFFHISEESNRSLHVINANQPWENLQGTLKNRVRLLAIALGWSLKHSHPRGSYMYGGDCLTLQAIQNVLPPPDVASSSSSSSGLHLSFPLDTHILTGAIFELSILGVIGDTTLTAAAWFVGSERTGMDFYDCCLVVIERHPAPPLRIPAMRVLASASIPFSDSDHEKGMELNPIPKGTPNWGKELVKWIYWVPCEDDRWLQFESLDSTISGKRRAKVMSSDQLADLLAQKILAISVTTVKEVKDTVRVSMEASELLVEFMKSK